MRRSCRVAGRRQGYAGPLAGVQARFAHDSNFLSFTFPSARPVSTRLVCADCLYRGQLCNRRVIRNRFESESLAQTITRAITIARTDTMSLSMLVGGGAECGPSNPLQSLSKRFDQDRGAQQVGHGGARETGCTQWSCVRHFSNGYAHACVFVQDVAGPSRSRGDLSSEVCRLHLCYLSGSTRLRSPSPASIRSSSIPSLL